MRRKIDLETRQAWERLFGSGLHRLPGMESTGSCCACMEADGEIKEDGRVWCGWCWQSHLEVVTPPVEICGADLTGLFQLLYQMHVVYFVQAADGKIKIGTTGCFPKRLQNLERDFGPLEILAVVKGGLRLERRIQRAFAYLRLADRPASCEWFEPGDALLDYIVTVRG